MNDASRARGAPREDDVIEDMSVDESLHFLRTWIKNDRSTPEQHEALAQVDAVALEILRLRVALVNLGPRVDDLLKKYEALVADRQKRIEQVAHKLWERHVGCPQKSVTECGACARAYGEIVQEITEALR